MTITNAEYDALARSACFVCRIVEGQPLFPNPRIVFEDDAVIAFFDQRPSQEGHTLVCPKRHAERFESDLSSGEWHHLFEVVQRVARSLSATTGAMRIYLASLGSPERNAHFHVHVCPCPAGTPFEKQQLAAMQRNEGAYLQLPEQRLDELAHLIRQGITVTDDVE